MFRFLGRLLLLGVLLVLIVGAVAAWLVYTPYGPSTETFVQIAPGSRTAAIATQLEQQGILRSKYAFLALRALGGTLHPGEYRFDHPIPPTEVYRRIAHGDIYTVALVVPEGYNLFDIAAAAEAAQIAPRADLLAAARSRTDLIRDLAPHAPSLEGFLFPATYRFPRHVSPELVLTAMIRRFRQSAAVLGLQGDALPTVTMASLVEKEVAVAAERPLVAGVFTNRLAKGMPLETDPAVIYAALLEGRYRGTIYRSDLESPSPYNTYRHAGLPPGPICNPGMAALRAALHPQQTDYLYFVADANGHTRFSADLKQHNQQVSDYRNALHP
ncbi:MAG TPA: endolytic transglycosylase MltG [Granulicella sp.]